MLVGRETYLNTRSFIVREAIYVVERVSIYFIHEDRAVVHVHINRFRNLEPEELNFTNFKRSIYDLGIPHTAGEDNSLGSEFTTISHNFINGFMNSSTTRVFFRRGKLSMRNKTSSSLNTATITFNTLFNKREDTVFREEHTCLVIINTNNIILTLKVELRV